MLTGIRGALVVICALLITAQPARAESKTFADLLDQAKAQAASGHRWAPPGDNMAETVITMMDLMPKATHEQLSELSALLDGVAPPAPAVTPTSPAVAKVEPTSRPDADRPISPQQVPPAQAGPASDSRAAVLFARGLQAEHQGDLSGARRFYLSSAQLGDAGAARNLGRLYDPAYLQRNAVGGIDPDPTLAQQWYKRAVRLGDAEAGQRLEALSVR